MATALPVMEFKDDMHFCNDFLVIKVYCWSYVFNIIKSIFRLFEYCGTSKNK